MILPLPSWPRSTALLVVPKAQVYCNSMAIRSFFVRRTAFLITPKKAYLTGLLPKGVESHVAHVAIELVPLDQLGMRADIENLMLVDEDQLGTLP